MSIDQHIHHTAPATITRTVISLSGSHDSDIAVHHARTADARISFTLGEVLMVFYNCAAVQGLLAAFASAKQHGALIPAQSPITVAAGDDGPSNRITVAIDWTRAPSYAAVAQSGLNKLHSHTLRWIDLYTAGITWQIRDRAASTVSWTAWPTCTPSRSPHSSTVPNTAPIRCCWTFPAPAENNP